MRELNGVWWTVNQKEVPGRLIITDENKIILITYEKLDASGVINGFADCEKITLVDVILDRTDFYLKPEAKDEHDGTVFETYDEVKYYNYTYIAQIAVFGETYKRKGDIRINSLRLKYTNLDEWVNWKTKEPVVKDSGENIIVEFKKFPEVRAKLERFDIVIGKPYFLIEKEYDMQIHNEISICVEKIKNQYINSLQETITCLQYFLILCMGDNINVTKINAIDFYGKNIELIITRGKSNYENRSVLKNIVKFEHIKDNLEQILENWIELCIENELLVANFINLQTREEPLISEYKNMATAIENLFLVMTKQPKTNEHFAEMVKRLIRETNFIFNLTEEEIQEIANHVKDNRRYFVHSNKTQREMVNNNISTTISMMNFLIEVVRVGIMLEIGIDKEVLEKYYHSVEQLKGLKHEIINKINVDEVKDDVTSEGVQNMRGLSKKDRENIAQLNAMMGTRYREVGYNLENTDDLIEAVEYITAEYVDYCAYWGDLYSIQESFDQSLEVFHPENWMNMVKADGTGNELIDEVISNLLGASESMYELKELAGEKCKEIWKVLLTGDNKEAKEYFFGEATTYTEEEIDEAFEVCADEIFQIGHENVVEEDCENFAKLLKKVLTER